MSTEFGQDHGLIHEAVVTGRKVGAGKDFWSALAHSEELFAKVVAFMATTLKAVFRFVPGFDHDMTKDGWKLLNDSGTKKGEFEPELGEFLKDKEGFVNGEEMMTRAQTMGNCAGQRHAEAMLRDSSKIPEEWRKYVLVFTDTVWQGSDGSRRVAYLGWDGDRWCLCFYWLRRDFDQGYRLVRLRK